MLVSIVVELWNNCKIKIIKSVIMLFYNYKIKQCEYTWRQNHSEVCYICLSHVHYSENITQKKCLPTPINIQYKKNNICVNECLLYNPRVRDKNNASQCSGAFWNVYFIKSSLLSTWKNYSVVHIIVYHFDS